MLYYLKNCLKSLTRNSALMVERLTDVYNRDILRQQNRIWFFMSLNKKTQCDFKFELVSETFVQSRF